MKNITFYECYPRRWTVEEHPVFRFVDDPPAHLILQEIATGEFDTLRYLNDVTAQIQLAVVTSSPRGLPAIMCSSRQRPITPAAKALHKILWGDDQ